MMFVCAYGSAYALPRGRCRTRNLGQQRKINIGFPKDCNILPGLSRRKSPVCWTLSCHSILSINLFIYLIVCVITHSLASIIIYDLNSLCHISYYSFIPSLPSNICLFVYLSNSKRIYSFINTFTVFSCSIM